MLLFIQISSKLTGIISVTTTNGCAHEGQAYAVGPFDVQCDQSCQCYTNGTVDCGSRCKPPLDKIGATDGDPLCVEQPVPGDACCVVVTCAGSAISDGHDGPCSGIECGPNARCRHQVFSSGDQAETICVCKEGFTGDPDSREGCYRHDHPDGRVTGITPKDGCLVNNNTLYNVNQTWTDGCDYTCTCSVKSEILCEVITSFPIFFNIMYQCIFIDL